MPPKIYQKFTSWKTQRKHVNRDLNFDWSNSFFNELLLIKKKNKQSYLDRN